MVKDIHHWNSFRKGAPRDVTLFHLRAEKMIIRVATNKSNPEYQWTCYQWICAKQFSIKFKELDTLLIYLLRPLSFIFQLLGVIRYDNKIRKRR